MSPRGLWIKFNEIFPYLVRYTKSYKSMNGDNRSIQITMTDNNVIIFTYYRDGNYRIMSSGRVKIYEEAND